MASTEAEPRPATSRRRVLITGANRGIGYATALELVRRGHDVVLTARDESAGRAAAARLRAARPGASVDAVALDLASFASIRGCAAGLAGSLPFDALIHNAGILVPGEERRLTSDGLEETLQVHAVGPMLLTTLLTPRLRRPARLVLVTSSLHEPGSHGAPVHFDFDDPQLERGYHRERAYKNAKLAQLWFALEWERRFGDAGLHADAVCPGFVPATVFRSARGLTRLLLRYVLPHMPFATSVEDAARIEAGWSLRDPGERGGRYFDGHRVKAPSPDARDPAKARAFWEMAQQWIGAPIGG